jgi:hypothetical protein
MLRPMRPNPLMAKRAMREASLEGLHIGPSTQIVKVPEKTKERHQAAPRTSTV